MSLPWLQDDYKRPQSKSKSRSRSRSGSRGRRQRSGSKKSRSRSPPIRDGGRGREKRPRKRSSSSSGSSDDSSSQRQATRLVASSRAKYINARIFVANISSKDISKNDIVKHFEKYGNVVDCLIHPKNYIFVQYLKEEHARLAVEGENGSTFNGFRIDVKMAKEGKGKNNFPHNNRDDFDPHDRRNKRPPPPRDPYGPDPFVDRHDRRPPPPFPPPPGEFGMRDPFYPPDPYRRGYPPDPWLPPDDPYRRDPFGDPFRDPYGPPRAPLPPPVPVGTAECEIFIVNPQLRNYGEMIERKVKDQSIITSLSILPEGRTAPQVVEDLTLKEGLFAIFLNAQNETHRSLTLNILHGTPQEHRNMPLDDAVGLIGRSFEKYVENLRAKANASASASTSGAAASISRVFLPPSADVSYLLNLLADNRALTVPELDSVIKYLKDRRDKLEDADKRPVITDEKELKKFAEIKAAEESKEKEKEKQTTHEELTKKILSIFSGVDPSIASTLAQATSSAVPAPAPAPAPPPAPSTSGANLINFDNPNVQKALDNLIQNGPSLLKTITSQGPVSASNTISSSSGRGAGPSAGGGGGGINIAPPVSRDMGMGVDGMMMMQGGHGGGMMGPDNMMMGGPDGNMGMFGPEHLSQLSMSQATAAAQAALAAGLANFNMQGMGPMGGPDFNNFGPMGQGGPPPPPPPHQRY